MHVVDKSYFFNSKKINFFPKLCVKVTSKCNFFCPFCCEPNRNQDEPSANDLIRLARRLARLGIKRISITGGEPLLNPDLKVFLKETNALNMYNLLLTADPFNLADHLYLISDFLDAIRISVHGFGSEHDNITGKAGVFKKLSGLISKIKSKNIEVSVTTVVTNRNINSLETIADWCIKKGITKLYLFRLLHSGRGYSFISEYGQPSMTKFKDASSELSTIFKHQGLKIYDYGFSDLPTCIVVYGDGRIICEPHSNYENQQKPLGNIFEDKPETIWSNFCYDKMIYKNYFEHFIKSIS